jgi:putative (di)nucleoside polyphosphate hydrolase
MSKPDKYRPCVGIALFNKDGLVFTGQRIDTPGAWQMPQGGIDRREDIETAARRELREEIGTDNIDIIKVIEEKQRYDLPDHLKHLWHGRYKGQEQTWVVARFLGAESEINLRAHTPPEFSSWKWMKLEETINFIVPFKKQVYSRVIELISPYAAP